MKTIHVHADWTGMGARALVGIASASQVRGKEVVSFEFDAAWLRERPELLLDAGLQAMVGAQYPEAGRGIGLLEDSAPDRWGRLLMKRREAFLARRENRPERPLFAPDFLLGVHDRSRLGGLRFKVDPEGPFLSEDAELTVPPISSLRKLASAARHLEEESENHPDLGKWLALLLAPGTSLGGARPKATVVDPQGRLWVAKFPASRDEYDVGALEAVVHRLAGEAGLRTVDASADKFSKNGHTFLVRRFDRDGDTRIHFASAMCLLGYRDGDGAESGASYLDLANFIRQHGAHPEADLEELWSRMVFSVAVRNTDDHMRNHGFLLTKRGWVLSPLFDVNPQPGGVGLALNIDENSNALDFDLVLATAPHFRVAKAHAQTIFRKIRKAVARWAEVAREARLATRDIDVLGRALAEAR